MRKITFLFALLFASVVSVFAGNLVCEGLVSVPSNSKCYFGGQLVWTSSSSNTMQIFSLNAGDLSDYTTLKLIPYNFIDRTDGQTVGTAEKIRVMFFAAGAQVGSTQRYATIDGNEKSIDLTTFLTDEERATVTEIVIGGVCDKGSVMIDVSSVKLIKSDASEFVCAGFVPRPSNNKVSYQTNVFGWTAASANTRQAFSFAAGSLSDYESLSITTSDFYTTLSGMEAAAKYRVLFLAGGSTVKTLSYISPGNLIIELRDELTSDQIASVDEIRFAGPNSGDCASGQVVVNPSDIYLTAISEKLVARKSIADFSWYDYANPENMYESGITNGLNLSRGQNTIIYGPTSASATSAFINVADYSTIEFNLSVTGTQGIRLMYNNDVTTIETNATTYNYSQALGAMDKIANIKTKNVSSLSAITVKSIYLSRTYDVTSADAWDLASNTQSMNFSYNREFTIGQESTVCLPFDLTAEEATEAGEFYELVAYDGSNLGFNPVAEPVAYTPYLFIPAKPLPFNNMNTSLKAVASTEVTADAATFKGVLQHIDDVKGAESGTVYGYKAANGEFVKVTGNNVSIDAFRAYIVVRSGPSLAPRLKVSLGHKTPTAIEDAQSPVQSTKVFRDGQLFIIRDGKTYNAMGQLINDK